MAEERTVALYQGSSEAAQPLASIKNRNKKEYESLELRKVR